MTKGQESRPVTLVSRLAWEQPAVPGDVAELLEVPHVRGVPVVDGVSRREPGERRRSWPNRAGILEQGAVADTVDWVAELASAPDRGRVVVHGGPTPVDLPHRLEWFRKFLRSLNQISGVEVPIAPDAPCGIVMTRGVDEASLNTASRPYPGACARLPAHLGEFPGGIQLVVTDEAWAQVDAYAGAVRDALNGKG